MSDYFVTGSSVAAVSVIAPPASSTKIAAANGKRRGLLVFNNTDKDLYVLLGGTAVSTSNYTVVIGTKIVYEVPRDYFTGDVFGLSAAGAAGKVSITEITDAVIASDSILPS